MDCDLGDAGRHVEVLRQPKALKRHGLRTVGGHRGMHTAQRHEQRQRQQTTSYDRCRRMCHHTPPSVREAVDVKVRAGSDRTLSMNATSSAQLSKCVAVPEITCSARPRGALGPPGSAAATCTTNARWAGNWDRDDRYACTCSPLA